MKVERVLGSAPLILLGVMAARTMPRRFGYWLSRRVARFMARRRTELFRIVRANHAHVLGPAASLAELDATAEKAIYHAGCTYFDMLHTTLKDYRRGRVSLRVDPEEWAIGRQALTGGRGTILVGPHMSNFDMAMQWFEAQGIKMQVLGLADPNLGTQVVNWLRGRRGVAVTPINMASLRQALSMLRGGGVVTTGVDRPVSKEDEPILFFDAPARLPTGHVRLALQTGARIVVACCLQDADNHYVIRVMPPLEMEASGHRRDDIRHNARRVLAVLEELIRQAPEQWYGPSIEPGLASAQNLPRIAQMA